MKRGCLTDFEEAVGAAAPAASTKVYRIFVIASVLHTALFAGVLTATGHPWWSTLLIILAGATLATNRTA